MRFCISTCKLTKQYGVHNAHQKDDAGCSVGSAVHITPNLFPCCPNVRHVMGKGGPHRASLVLLPILRSNFCEVNASIVDGCTNLSPREFRLRLNAEKAHL